MPQTYAYKVRDRKGKVTSGTLEGDDPQAVALRLREMGFTPLNVGVQRTGLKTEINLRPGHVDLKQIAIFCRQFATMVNAGLPVLRCLSTLAEQTPSKELARVLQQVRSDVERGMSLTDAMRVHPKTFNRLLVAMVRTGETTGMLGDVLAEVATQTEKEVALRGKIRSAMTYPIAVVGLVIFILFAMLVFVVPQFETIYSSMDAQLPLVTRVLLGASRFLQTFWWVAFIAAAGLAYGFVRFRATDEGRRRIDGLKLRMPILGDLFRKAAVARFSTTLGILLKAGVPVLPALDVVSETVGNVVISESLGNVKRQVRQGETISRPLGKEPVFPPMVVQMMAVGEESGSVDTMMEKVSTFYTEEVSATVDGLTSLIEPVLLVIIGGVVGSAVIALYLPMFNIIKLIK